MALKIIHSKKGLSLLELLAVIAILIILFSVIMPAVTRVRDNAKTVVCVSNLKQIALAILQYALDREHLPSSIYQGDVSAYYGDDYSITYCPADDRVFPVSNALRGSYGIYQGAESYGYSANAQEIPLVGDCTGEYLIPNTDTFATRHKGNTKGNMAFLDGHVDQLTADQFP